MIRRIIYFLLVTILLGGMAGGIYFFSFQFLPNMIATAIKSAPPPVQTVSAEDAKSETWQPEVLGIGTLVASEGIDIAPQVGGVVKELNFASGAKVKKGDKLLQIDTATDDAELKTLRVQLANAETELARKQKVFDRGYAASADVDALRTSRDVLLANIDKMQQVIAQKSIFAPWDGTVGISNISVGSFVAPGQKIVWLQKTDPIYADFSVTEQDIGRVKIGEKVSASFAAWPGQTFEGQILTTDAKLADATRTITVRATLGNADGKLLPGMYANVAVAAGAPEEVLTVAQTAVIYSLYGDNVLVVVPAKKPDPKNKEAQFEIERRFIKAGPMRGGRVQIVDGLKAGDKVVTAGHNKVDQGSPVRVDNSVALRQSESATIQ